MPFAHRRARLHEPQPGAARGELALQFARKTDTGDVHVQGCRQDPNDDRQRVAGRGEPTNLKATMTPKRISAVRST